MQTCANIMPNSCALRFERPLPCLPRLHAAGRGISRHSSRRLHICSQATAVPTQQQGASTLVHARPSPQQPKPPRTKTRVVVLGSGWAAVSFLKNIDPKAFGEDGPYELTLVSPRNYFLFTPLLPSAVSGTVEERSIVEPIRNLIHGKGSYYEAECLEVDTQARVLTCLRQYCEVCQARRGVTHSDEDHTFQVPYDILLLGVGAVNNTFGIQGVAQHCWFLKTIDEAHKLRVHISKCIEHAGLPTTTPEERRRLLSFVVVGGGPTGCELAAELHDLIAEDVACLFPHLKGEVSISLVETQDHLLNAYDRQIAEYAGNLFEREGINLLLNTSVLSVEDSVLHMQRRGEKAPQALEFGTCVWATGVGMNPLVKSIKAKLPAAVQTSPSGLVVDRFLRVKGAGGRILALGDAAVTNQDKALEHAASLFAQADTNHDDKLSEPEVHALLKKAQREYPQMGELARQLEDGLMSHAVSGMWHPERRMNKYTRHLERLQRGLSYDEFRELLADVDTMLRALPATAQVARQEGEYLARVFSEGKVKLVAEGSSSESGDGASSEGGSVLEVQLDDSVEPFQYAHLGSLAYLGMDRAVMQLPSVFPIRVLKGWLVGQAWRGMETFMQVSLRNQWMVLNDWLRTKMFGRNLSDV